MNPQQNKKRKVHHRFRQVSKNYSASTSTMFCRVDPKKINVISWISKHFVQDGVHSSRDPTIRNMIQDVEGDPTKAKESLKTIQERVCNHKLSVSLIRRRITVFSIFYIMLLACWNGNYPHVLFFLYLCGGHVRELYQSGKLSLGRVAESLYRDHDILLVAMSSALLRSREWINLKTAFIRSSSVLCVPFLYLAFKERGETVLPLPVITLVTPYLQSVHTNVTTNSIDSPSFPNLQILFGCCLMANNTPSHRATGFHLIAFIVWWLCICASVSSRVCEGECHDEVIPIKIHGFCILLLNCWYFLDHDNASRHHPDFTAVNHPLKVVGTVLDTRKGLETDTSCKRYCSSCSMDQSEDKFKEVDTVPSCFGNCSCKCKENGLLAKFDWPNAFFVISHQVISITLTAVLLASVGSLRLIADVFLAMQNNIHFYVVVLVMVFNIVAICPWIRTANFSGSDRRFIVRLTAFSFVSLFLRAMLRETYNDDTQKSFAYAVIAWFIELSTWVLTVDWPLRTSDFHVMASFAVIRTTVMSGTNSHRHILDGLATLYILDTRAYGQLFASRQTLVLVLILMIGGLAGSCGANFESLSALCFTFSLLTYSLFNLEQPMYQHS